jgi:hypothetical protein
MEQSISSELSLSLSKILRLLWEPNVHYSVHKSLPLYPVFSHFIPIHIPYDLHT